MLKYFVLNSGLVAGLIVVNIVAQGVLPARYDASSQKLFTLTSQTREQLRLLSHPVCVTLLARRTSRHPDEIAFQKTLPPLRELLDLYHREQPALVVQELDPDHSEEARRLLQRYPDLNPACVLIVGGDAAAPRHEVLYDRDLIELQAASAGGARQARFFGEAAVTGALARLESGRKQTVVCVLTGHGESSLSDRQPASRQSLALLAARLAELDFELRPLNLAATPQIPPDADFVFLAGPTQPYLPAEAAVLRAWLHNGGRALCLFGSAHVGQTRAVHTGLEPLLADFGVELAPDKLAAGRWAGRQQVALATAATEVDHPLVRRLPVPPPPFLECCGFQPVTGPTRLKTRCVPILVSHSARPVPIKPAPLRERPGSRDEADSASPVVLVLAVDRPVEGAAVPAAEPVLLIAGDAGFVSNQALSSPGGEASYNFFLTMAHWLRGPRERSGAISPRTQVTWRMTGDDTTRRQLVLQSMLILLAATITAGATAWTTRFRGRPQVTPENETGTH